MRHREGNCPARSSRLSDHLHRDRAAAGCDGPAQPGRLPERRDRGGNLRDLAPYDQDRFDLVFAATAWHWIDPAVRYRRAWELLPPGGHLAFWSAAHVFPEGGDPFFAEIQDVYDEIGEGLPGARQVRPSELPDSRAEIMSSGLFEDVAVRRFDWEVSYDAEEYIRLLDTFSGHIAMQAWQRDRLYAEIRRRLAQRPDGLLARHWGAVLNVARRRDLSIDPGPCAGLWLRVSEARWSASNASWRRTRVLRTSDSPPGAVEGIVKLYITL